MRAPPPATFAITDGWPILKCDGRLREIGWPEELTTYARRMTMVFSPGVKRSAGIPRGNRDEGCRVTRAEALRIVDDIRAGRARIVHTEHFTKRLLSRGYDIQDVQMILGQRRIERTPCYDEKRNNYKVTLRGRSDDGRDTRLVLGLRLNGPNTYVTIVDLEHVG